MSVTDSTSGLTLNQVLANSAQAKTTDTSLAGASKAVAGSSSLGKDSFLQLLVTQLKNQNPLDPQDNTAFVAQLAQFSSLEGITTLNDSVNSITGGLQSSQALQASSLVGRSVIVQTGEAYVDPSSGKPFNGSVVVQDADSKPTITITDADGEVVRTLDLGTQKAGNVDFTWDGKDSDGLLLDKGNYTFTASSKTDTATTALTTYLPATVNSVTLSKTGGEIMLNLAGLGSIGISKVQTIRPLSRLKEINMSFNIGLSGLYAANKQLDVTGNNIANVATTGFKASRAEFADIYSASKLGTGSKTVGSGVNLAAVSQNFGQGAINNTGNLLDMGISGSGFFVLSDNGALSYTRAGTFKSDKDGYVTSTDGTARLQGYGVDANGNIVNGT